MTVVELDLDASGHCRLTTLGQNILAGFYWHPRQLFSTSSVTYPSYRRKRSICGSTQYMVWIICKWRDWFQVQYFKPLLAAPLSFRWKEIFRRFKVYFTHNYVLCWRLALFATISTALLAALWLLVSNLSTSNWAGRPHAGKLDEAFQNLIRTYSDVYRKYCCRSPWFTSRRELLEQFPEAAEIIVKLTEGLP